MQIDSRRYIYSTAGKELRSCLSSCCTHTKQASNPDLMPMHSLTTDMPESRSSILNDFTMQMNYTILAAY